MQYISSTQNKTYKLIKSLKQKKSRVSENLYCIEGIKGCIDAVNKGADVRIIAVRNGLYEKISHRLPPNGNIYIVDDEIFDALCDTKNPEGIICALKIQEPSFDAIDGGLYIYLDALADPGNCGTIIRTCDACGGAGVLLSPDSVDLYNPKTIRSSMGSFFSCDVHTDVNHDMLNSLKSKGYKIVCAALCHNASDYKKFDYPDKTVIVIGNESNGISDDCLSLADNTVIIPISGEAESLNASVAAGILMYEWHRNN